MSDPSNLPDLLTHGKDKIQPCLPLSPVRKILGTFLILLTCTAIGYFAFYKNIAANETMDTPTAFMLMLSALVLGEIISIRTKAALPAIFITALLFIIGFWTFFPKTILQIGGIAPNLPGFCVMLMVTHLGTMLDKDELLAQWKTILITLAGMVGIIFFVLSLGWPLLGKMTAVVAAPPLTGGLVSAIIMQGAVHNDQHLFILAMAVYVLQGFAGFPLTNICLRIEGKNILSRIRQGDLSWRIQKKSAVQGRLHYRLFPETPHQYQTDALIILKTVLLVLLSGYLEQLVNGALSRFVFALVLGVAAAEVGFIERKPLERSRSIGLFMIIIMMYVFSGLNNITMEILINLLIEFIVLIGLSIIGIALFAIPVGVKLGLSKAMSFAIGLGTLAGGFPASYVLSEEAAKILASDEREYKLLLDHFLPKTLVAGFISATTGSVLIAGVFISLFF